MRHLPGRQLDNEMEQNTEVRIEELYRLLVSGKIIPRVLPLTMWRAWELAAYRRFQLPEPVLDLGCGDGLFFKQVWPQIEKVVGIDINTDAVQRASQSGIYERVHLSPAHQIPEADATLRRYFLTVPWSIWIKLRQSSRRHGVF